MGEPRCDPCGEPHHLASPERRAFLTTLGGGLLAVLALQAGAARGSAGPLYVGCGLDEAGGHVAAGFDARARRLFEVALPDRGHDVAFHPSRPECVVFARRAGTFAVVIDLKRGVAIRRLDAAPGRHFYGHGVFSSDGRTLFTTENEIESARGLIGIRDASDGYREIGTYHSGGIGPHDVILMPDGATLAIANGGIRTHPDTGRAKLNLETMNPSLAYVGLTDGELMEAFHLAPGLHQNSIRHLARDARGRVGVALQYEGAKGARVPLVGIHEGGALRLFEPPAAIERRMRHYAGSIAFDAGGGILAVSHPRGSLVTFWDAGSGALIRHVELADGCGVAADPLPGRFVLTGGFGDVQAIDVGSGEVTPLEVQGAVTAWDNHLARHLG